MTIFIIRLENGSYHIILSGVHFLVDICCWNKNTFLPNAETLYIACLKHNTHFHCLGIFKQNTVPE